jgi:hypothetical protein
MTVRVTSTFFALGLVAGFIIGVMFDQRMPVKHADAPMEAKK